MYDAIWSALKKIKDNAIEKNLKTITSDFERAQINSAKKNFPLARVSGCKFHYRHVSHN